MGLFDFFKRKQQTETNTKQATEETAPVELPDDYTSSIVEKLLTELNCSYKVQEMPKRNCKRYHFTFQACNFSLDAFSKSHSANLQFPYVAVTQIDELELYKKVCMEMNYYQNPTKFVYYTDDADGTCYININHYLHFNQESPANREYLESTFENMFRMRHLMSREIDQQRENLKYDKRCDYRKEVDSRMSYLLRQQEENDQFFPINRDAWNEGQTLMGYVDYFFGVRKSDISSIKVINDSEITYADAESIKNGAFALDKYRLLESVVEFDKENKTVIKKCDNSLIEICYSVTALADKFKPTPSRKIIISLTVEDDNENCIFVRTTATRTPLPPSRSSAMSSKNYEPESYSAIICAEKRDKSSYDQEFEYVWNETADMAENGDFDKMNEEQKLICAVNNTDVAYHVFWGTKLMTECRYYEATYYLENAFNELQDNYAMGDDHDKRTMTHVAYQLGFAYSELGQHRRAIFFSEIGFILGKKLSYTESYINSLVNSNDFRCLSIIDDHLRRTVEYEQQEGEDNTVTHLKNFLLRRKGTVLINQGLYEEAHEYLNELAKNPDCLEFVEKELARLKKLEDLDK